MKNILVILALSISGNSHGSISCCWCIEKATHENAIRNYQSEGSCEKMQPFYGMYSSCRRVEVKGKVCSFVEIERGSGGIKCTPNVVEYVESGAVKKIEPPRGPIGPCATKNLIESFSGQENLKSLGSTQVKEEKKTGPIQENCTCGTDTDNDSQCILISIKDGVRAVVSSAPKPATARGCIEAVCRKLFSSEIAQCQNYHQ